MNLSRKWLNEFVKIDAPDREFAEAMTLSGSKVETTEDLGAEISNVVVGRIVSMDKHPNSDHMWVCGLDVGRDEPVQIVTGAWNVHVGDLVPVALHRSTLPGGKKIEKGNLRGVKSNGMLCSLRELGLDERDFPYAVITAAALLNDYHPIDPEKPSIPADIAPGAKIYGPVVAARVTDCAPNPDGTFTLTLEPAATAVTPCQNVHAGDMVAHNTKTNTVCTLSDLRAEQREFPHCIEDGIFVLREPCAPGDDIKPVINADDSVVEFEITPNRPDCLSVIGLAREVAATFDKPLTLHEPAVRGGGPGVLTDLLSVETRDPDLCPRYTARMVRNVKIAPSPKWMRERLRSMGVRPINNIVDITNYVMLEYGQPMHAFDYRYVQGGKIVVRRASEGEELTTLDGQVHTLNANHLVIADDTRAVGLAGIMGGLNSEIVADTADVVFESANFDGTCIRKGALALGMRTEASAKFEKGLDVMNTLPAVNRACELVELLRAGEVLDGVIDVQNRMPEPYKMTLEPEKINALLGTDVPESEMVRILRKLDFQVDGRTVTVPSFRGDVRRMADLAEEVARFYGYNNIPVTLMRGQTTEGGYNDAQKLENKLGALARECGYDEIITYSFISPSAYDKILWAPEDPRRQSFKILNPLGEDTSIMRTTSLPSILDILARNNNFRNKNVKLYELGRVYLPGGEDGLADERRVLTLGAYGDDMDFYAMKGAVETILRGIRARDVEFVPCADNPSYHPGRCAKVTNGDAVLGVVGQIHPLCAKNYGLDAVYAAELDFSALLASRGPDPEYRPLPRYPSVARDLAIVADKSVTVGQIERCIRENGGKYLRGVALFDIYEGPGVPEGKRSTAYSLTLRADDGTLTDDHADETVKAILAALHEKLGAVIR